MQSNKFFFVAAVLLAAAIWLWSHKNVDEIPKESYHSYSQALGSLSEGDSQQAVRYMQTALDLISVMEESPKKRVLKANVEYNLAIVLNLSGDSTRAIQLSKKIAADTSYPIITRAKAVQHMAEMLFGEIDITKRAGMQDLIFKDSPYVDMFVSDDWGLSTRHLSEYASSLYPIAQAELRIAEWYARSLLLNSLSTTTSQGVRYVDIIQKKIESANSDISRTESLSTAQYEIPKYLVRKAVIIDVLSNLGVVSLTSADSAYKEALDAYIYYERSMGSDSMVRLNYAGFLAHAYGSNRAKDIHDLVQIFYDKTIDSSAWYATLYLKSLGSVPSGIIPRTTRGHDKLRMLHIARIDNQFEGLLVSFGWKKEDFADSI